MRAGDPFKAQSPLFTSVLILCTTDRQSSAPYLLVKAVSIDSNLSKFTPKGVGFYPSYT